MKNNLPMQLRCLVEQFIAGNPNFKTYTQRNYRCSILRTLCYLEKGAWKNGLPVNIKQETIARWLKTMKKRYVALYTIIPRMRRVAVFFQFLKDNGYMRENPLGALKEKYPRKGLKAVIMTLLGSSAQDSLNNLKPLTRFISPLGCDMKKFIMLGRAQGKSYHAEEQILCVFDRLLATHPDHPRRLSDSILKQWLNLFADKSESHRWKNVAVVRRFCFYLCRFNPKVYVPLISLPFPKPTPAHIYSTDEINILLKAIRRLEPSPQFFLRPQMLYLLVLLLYTTGMRVGEALKIRLKDIDWQEEKIYLRETKFFKSRLIPLSHSMAEELKNYLTLRNRAGLPNTRESFLFQNPHRKKPYDRSTIEKLFRKELRDIGLKPMHGYNGPRIHDLRHTFAVHRLERWYREGKNVQSRLGLISTYLGHAGIAGTQRYLTMTAELLQQASQRFNQHFTSTLTQGAQK
jgi:integrase